MTQVKTPKRSPIRDHPGQLSVWKSNARFIVCCAGRRWGKTYLSIEMLLRVSDTKDSRCVYVAPTYGQARDIVWDALKKRLVELGWKFRSNETQLTIYRTNGSRIFLKSADVEARFRGQKYDFAILDEVSEFKSETIWTEAIRPCLSDTRGKAIFIFTPKGISGLSYKLFNMSKTTPDWECFNFRTIDAPHFQTKEGLEEIESAKRDLTPDSFAQEYLAEFVSHSGRIYHAFDRVKCNTDLQYDPSLPILLGTDFNRSPATSCIFQKISGKLIQVDEVFIKVADTEQLCQEIRRRYENAEITVRPDATGNRKTSNSSLSDFDIMRRYGFSIDASPVNPRRLDRWASVNRALDKGLVFINIAKCKMTCRDMEMMIYKDGSCEANLSDPFLGHISDAFGYAVHKEYPVLLPQKSRIGFYA